MAGPVTTGAIQDLMKLDADLEVTGEGVRREIRLLMDRFAKDEVTSDVWCPVLLAMIAKVLEERMTSKQLAGTYLGTGVSVFFTGGRTLDEVLAVVREVWAHLQKMRPN